MPQCQTPCNGRTLANFSGISRKNGNIGPSDKQVGLCRMMLCGNIARGINWTKQRDRSPISAMRTDELDFHLPAELIAQSPSIQRAASRLLHFRKSTGLIAHRVFTDLPGLLRRGDLLVFNDAR